MMAFPIQFLLAGYSMERGENCYVLGCNTFYAYAFCFLSNRDARIFGWLSDSCWWEALNAYFQLIDRSCGVGTRFGWRCCGLLVRRLLLKLLDGILMAYNIDKRLDGNWKWNWDLRSWIRAKSCFDELKASTSSAVVISIADLQLKDVQWMSFYRIEDCQYIGHQQMNTSPWIMLWVPPRLLNLLKNICPNSRDPRVWKYNRKIGNSAGVPDWYEEKGGILPWEGDEVAMKLHQSR